MSTNQNSTEHLLDSSDPPQCALPALLGPPKQAACFSLCNEQLRVDSIAALRYFVHPPENVNLKAGYDRLSHKQRSFKRVRRLDHILAMCLQSKNSKQLLKVEVITWRGILKK
jgi:RAT1-interacting protein